MNTQVNRTLIIERSFKSPLNSVWDAWKNPDKIVEWWGPKGMTTRVLIHDFNVGGQWKYAMNMPDGNEFITEGRYSNIVEGEKIASSADFKPMTEGVDILVILKSEAETTHFTFNVVHPSEEYCRQQKEMGFYKGWNSTFDRLESYLKNSDQ